MFYANLMITTKQKTIYTRFTKDKEMESKLSTTENLQITKINNKKE
jgi:hypothetical protein